MKILSTLALFLAGFTIMAQTNFKSERISKSSSFEVDGQITKVFPLFGPIREKEWAEGWDPEIVFGSADKIEEHFIFRTTAPTDERFYLWTISQLDREKYTIEYTVSTEHRIWFIRVACTSTGAKTVATVTYTYTGLDEKGNALNRAALEKMFSHDLKDWQQAINYYLQHNKQLTVSQTR